MTRLARLRSQNILVVLPAIADYEVRRGLLVARASAGLRRLDALKSEFTFREVGPADLKRAAELWAYASRRGGPIAGPYDLGADAIVAAQAIHAGKPGHSIIIATDNLRHFERFPQIEAITWQKLPRNLPRQK
jgi:predicted nucleic acid-binding protein